jgi:AraC-like DNA-binding protein
VTRRTIATRFIRGAAALAGSQSLNIAPMLREAAISPDLLDQDAARVTDEQATRLIRSLWDATDDELFGVGSRPMPRGTFKMMALGLIHTPDLRAELVRIIEFAPIGTGFEAAAMTDDGHVTRVCFQPGDGSETDQFVRDICMVVAHRFAGWLIGERIVLNSVDLPRPASSLTADYLSVYGVAPDFEAPGAALTFHSRYLAAPVIRNEEELLAFLRTAPNDLLFRQDYHPTTTSRVRKMIERGAFEAITVDDVAQRLNISGQHLRRLIRDEGTTFRQIKGDVLRDEAIASLVRRHETIEGLSQRLGFSEASAFRRAFHRWTGNRPGSYRPVSAPDSATPAAAKNE